MITDLMKAPMVYAGGKRAAAAPTLFDGMWDDEEEVQNAGD